ncbi:MAG TPA: hypothetical protein VMP01_17430 [Pirellulaceae bacterium]|nr:hypothetical protein [Pirellulaceae bacterium]
MDGESRLPAGLRAEVADCGRRVQRLAEKLRRFGTQPDVTFDGALPLSDCENGAGMVPTYYQAVIENCGPCELADDFNDTCNLIAQIHRGEHGHSGHELTNATERLGTLGIAIEQAFSSPLTRLDLGDYVLPADVARLHDLLEKLIDDAQGVSQNVGAGRRLARQGEKIRPDDFSFLPRPPSVADVVLGRQWPGIIRGLRLNARKLVRHRKAVEASMDLLPTAILVRLEGMEAPGWKDKLRRTIDRLFEWVWLKQACEDDPPDIEYLTGMLEMFDPPDWNAELKVLTKAKKDLYALREKAPASHDLVTGGESHQQAAGPSAAATQADMISPSSGHTPQESLAAFTAAFAKHHNAELAVIAVGAEHVRDDGTVAVPSWLIPAGGPKNLNIGGTAKCVFTMQHCCYYGLGAGGQVASEMGTRKVGFFIYAQPNCDEAVDAFRTLASQAGAILLAQSSVSAAPANSPLTLWLLTVYSLLSGTGWIQKVSDGQSDETYRFHPFGASVETWKRVLAASGKEADEPVIPQNGAPSTSGRTVRRDEYESRKLVTERYAQFKREYKALGYGRPSYEHFAAWTADTFDDMPSDDAAELKRLVEAHRKTPSPRVVD